MKKLLRTNKSKWLATLIAFFLVGIVLVGFGVKLSRQDKTAYVNGFNYSIGSISATTGKAVESKLSLYTKDMCNVDGMEIKVKDDATITYKVAFYDEDKDFISMSTASAEDFDAENLPEGAKFFRVMIIPNEVDGEPVTIKLYQIAHYANQLEITYNK